ncbi:MAG: hypothetical protein GY757_48780, partial [bacterium]|nr:hypothetical protein [bacterium]
IRMVRVEMDKLYAPSKFQQAKNLDLLLERIQTLCINTVILQAFSDSDGDGVAEALYFPNRHMPVRADIFNRVAWQLKTRCHTRILAWMPVTRFTLPGKSGRYIQSPESLSLYNKKNRQIIADIYEDLGKHADFEGLLFDSGADFFTETDTCAQALKHYKEKWQLPQDMAVIKATPTLHQLLNAKNAEFLFDFTWQLTKRVEKNRLKMITAGYVYPEHLTDSPSKSQVDAIYPFFRENYNYTVIHAMPYKKKTGNPDKWLKNLVRKARTMDPTLRKTLFELQTVHRLSGSKIKTSRIVQRMELLQMEGALCVGYSPDDFIDNHPKLKKIHTAISLQNFPYRKK